jgi:hypothetical protein
VDVGGVHCVAYNWLRSARVYFHIASANCLQNRAGVERRLVECCIAVDGADAEELDARIVGAKKKGVCVLSTSEQCNGTEVTALTSWPVSCGC